MGKLSKTVRRHIEAAIELHNKGEYAGSLNRAGEAEDLLADVLSETALSSEAAAWPLLVQCLTASGDLEPGEVDSAEAAYYERARRARDNAEGHGLNLATEAVDTLHRAISDYGRLTGNFSTAMVDFSRRGLRDV